MKHIGNLEISIANHNLFSQLEEVTGDLTINLENGTLTRLPMLARVAGNLKLSGKVELTRLTSVLGNLALYDVFEPSILEYEGLPHTTNERYILPSLSSVSGSLEIHADVDLPVLACVGRYLHIGERRRLEKNFLFDKGIGVNGNLPSLATIIVPLQSLKRRIYMFPL